MQVLLKPQLEVNWAKLVWSSSNVPKHAFIFWLAMQNGLLTRAKWHYWGILRTDECLLYNSARDDIGHLFFKCEFSRSI